MTEEHLLAREEDGAASIVEVYAALLLGFVTESDLAQQQVGTQNALSWYYNCFSGCHL